MEHHVLYFDRDGDGVIWPHDSAFPGRCEVLSLTSSLAAFIALHELGFNLLLSLLGVLV